MGRRRKSHHFLPARVYQKGKCFWYAGTKPWLNLGSDVTEMFTRYAELEKLSPRHTVDTFGELAAEYRVRALDKLALRTQRDYAKYLDGDRRLMAAFGGVPLANIRPTHVTQYHAIRGETAAVQANREKACFSSIWNWGRRTGLTDLPNPCEGVRRHRETGRKTHVDDALFFRVWQAADWDMRDALDLAYLCGQRPADTAKMAWSDVEGDVIKVVQGKTQERVRVEIKGDLALVLSDIALRRGCTGKLVPLTYSAIDNRLDDVRLAAGVDFNAFQFRDLRAKAATDVTEHSGLRTAQGLLGHTTQKTTETYVRRRVGKKVRPAQ